MITSRKIEGLEATAAEIGGDIAVFAGNAGDIDTADACVPPPSTASVGSTSS